MPATDAGSVPPLHAAASVVVVVATVVVVVASDRVDVVDRAVVVGVGIVVVLGDGIEVLVPASQSQLRDTGCPVALRRQIRASVAVGGRVPFGAQTHSGSHVAEPTAVFRMRRQSVAVGRQQRNRGDLKRVGYNASDSKGAVDNHQRTDPAIKLTVVEGKCCK
jgi:hypothetical protein